MNYAPTLIEIEAANASLMGRIVATPTLTLNSSRIAPHLPANATVHMKMELFQQAGSFKARGVLLAIDVMGKEEKAAGVTAVSAGNHALAVSWGAKNAGLSATVVMPNTADKIRVNGCIALGAEVKLVENVGDAFKEADRLVKEEGRTMLHPFESPFMTLGAATCGYEFAKAHPEIEVLLVPVGGGGLISGMSHTFKLLNPNCEIIGIEPFGADSMWQSFEKGEAVHLDGVNTIADSLGAPMAMPNSFNTTRANVNEIIRIEDDDMRKAMTALYDALKIIAEPACAATTAATMGPLNSRLEGKIVGVIACGSNISLEKYQTILSA
ncbi:MAG: pyridoxal-phosphate dependent enzyme [Rhizobiaceae bacterium]